MSADDVADQHHTASHLLPAHGAAPAVMAGRSGERHPPAPGAAESRQTCGT